MPQFPLQNKKLQKCVLPYITIGTCEIMNEASHFLLDSFYAFNKKNRPMYSSSSSTSQIPHNFGDMVATGLLDSYTGREVSTFISDFLSRALSLHTRVPEELRALKREFPNDPVIDAMSFALSHQRSMRGLSTKVPGTATSPINAWDMEQYALCADSAFLQHCQKLRSDSGSKGDESGDHFMQKNTQQPVANRSDPTTFSGGLRDTGCRGIWFSATLVPGGTDCDASSTVVSSGESRVPALCSSTALDVCVSGLGSSRAFGLARNALSPQRVRQSGGSPLDPSLTENIVPLSMDHIPLREEEYRRIINAGGHVVSQKGNMIDGNPYYTVSRSFGHFSMKSDRQRSPSQQKIICLPTTTTWRMLPGDVLVLCNHAVFENRQQENTTVDEVVKVIARELDRGNSPEAVAASVCDFAMRFGASHSLQVTVAVATNPDERNSSHRLDSNPSSDSSKAHATFGTEPPLYTEWVEPGPVPVEMCRRHGPYFEALMRDCQRCGVSLPELLWLRWKQVRHVLPQRYALPLASLYGRETGILQQSMEEEAQLFSHPLLVSKTSGDRDADTSKDACMAVFNSIAKSLSPRRL